MAATKTFPASDRTHDGFRRETQRRGATIDEVAAAALRALHQRHLLAAAARQGSSILGALRP